jgi:hypothetical protein
LGDEIEKNEMGGAEHIAHKGETRGAYRVLVGRPKEKNALGMPSLRWKYNIKIDLQAVGWGGIVWIDRNAGAETCHYVNEPSISIKQR